jgi:ketosteroid isomerase-like protein
MRLIKLGSLVGAAAMPFALCAQDPSSVTEAVIVKHFEIASTGTLDELLEDYADDAVLIGPDGILYKGKAAIRAGFAEVMRQEPRPTFQLTVRVFDDNVGYVQWVATYAAGNGFRGSDSFVMENGRIVLQTGVMYPIE